MQIRSHLELFAPLTADRYVSLQLTDWIVASIQHNIQPKKCRLLLQMDPASTGLRATRHAGLQNSRADAVIRATRLDTSSHLAQSLPDLLVAH